MRVAIKDLFINDGNKAFCKTTAQFFEVETMLDLLDKLEALDAKWEREEALGLN